MSILHKAAGKKDGPAHLGSAADGVVHRSQAGNWPDVHVAATREGDREDDHDHIKEREDQDVAQVGLEPDALRGGEFAKGLGAFLEISSSGLGGHLFVGGQLNSRRNIDGGHRQTHFAPGLEIGDCGGEFGWSDEQFYGLGLVFAREYVDSITGQRQPGGRGLSWRLPLEE